MLACKFSYIYNACGCLTGYNVPLKTVTNIAIGFYPVEVLNINGVALSEATTPAEYIAIWNSDLTNQTKGTLSIGSTDFCFVLSKVRNVTPPGKVLANAPFTFYYGATDADTTGAPLTQSQLITSVDSVFASHAELTGTGPNTGDNVQVNSFANATDKVLFIQVPSSEAVFTKWSEVGNPLQQLQPIDAGFAGTNVFFKTTRAGQTLYLTRFQTSFTGAIILSR